MKITAFIAVLLLATTTSAQKNKTTTPSENQGIATHVQLFKNALQYSDANVAVNSLHNIILQEGENSTYKDTLAVVYFRTNNFVSSYLLTKELLVKSPNDMRLLEMNAVSLQKLGDSKSAIPVYETLFGLSKNQYHGYQLATLQLGLQRIGEAQTTLDKAMKCEELKEATIPFAVNAQQQQKVPLKVALINLKGVLAYEQKDTKTAATAFDESLTLMPDFEMAKQNKAALEKESKEVNESKKAKK